MDHIVEEKPKRLLENLKEKITIGAIIIILVSAVYSTQIFCYGYQTFLYSINRDKYLRDWEDIGFSRESFADTYEYYISAIFFMVNLLACEVFLILYLSSFLSFINQRLSFGSYIIQGITIFMCLGLCFKQYAVFFMSLMQLNPLISLSVIVLLGGIFRRFFKTSTAIEQFIYTAFIYNVIVVLFQFFGLFEEAIENECTPITKYASEKFIESLSKLCKKADIDISKIFVWKKEKLNAFATKSLSGYLIIVFSKLLDELPRKLIMGVLAHEMGHALDPSILNLYYLIILKSLIELSVIIYIYKNYNEKHGAPTTLLYVSESLMVINFTFTILRNYFARDFEYEADAFADSLGYGDLLSDSLIEISKSRTHNYDVCGAVEFLRSHPSVKNRLSKISQGSV